jgi:tight adherence protein C
MNISMADLLPFFITVGVILLVFMLLNFISRRNRAVDERIQRVVRARPGQSQADIAPPGASPGLEKVQDLISKAQVFSGALMPKTELEQNVLKLRLANAGFRNEKAVSVYLGIKMISLVVLTVIPAFILVPTKLFPYSYDNLINFLQWMLPFFVAGFYGPDLVLAYIKGNRQQEIFLTLPDALDLLVVCVESGLGLDAGMRRVCQEMKDHAKTICEELEIANFQLQMGRAKRDVLHDLGVRTGVDDVRSLAAILIQADRFGSSVAQALRVQSDSMRVRRRQIAEEKAAKTAVQLLFPLVLFIFPGIFVILVGPAYLLIKKYMPGMGGNG